jgi:hypothetical protein
MNSDLLDALQEAVDDSHALRHKMVIVTGSQQVQDAQLVNRIVQQLNARRINVNEELSEALLDVPQEQRQLWARDWLTERVRNADENVIVLTDIELVFAEQLRLRPMSLLEALSRHKPIILMWPGEYDGSHLIYAEPGHPEYIKRKPEGIVIEMANSKH